MTRTLLRKTLLVGAFLALADVAAAQRVERNRMGGDKRADWDKIENTGGRQIPIQVKDVQRWSPVKLLIDKTKDLKLTDAQLTSLRDADTRSDEALKPLLVRLDSLRIVSKPRAGVAQEEEAPRLQIVRQEFGDVLSRIMLHYDSSAVTSKAFLDEAQQKKADEMFTKQKKDATDAVTKELGGRRARD